MKTIILSLCLLAFFRGGFAGEPDNGNMISPNLKDVCKGKIQVTLKRDEVFFILNWDSSAKALLKITGRYRNELFKYDGQIITVKGIIQKQTASLGTIDIYEIISTAAGQYSSAPVIIDNREVYRGKIEATLKRNEVFFIQNWDSESKLYLKVTGKLRNELFKYDGKIIDVKGEIDKQTGRFGTIEIKTILGVINAGNPATVNIATITNYVYLTITNYITITNYVKSRPHDIEIKTQGEDDEGFINVKVEVSTGDNEVYLVIKPESRSRISLKVIGDYKKSLFRQNGRMIRARGDIIKDSQWSGTIDVKEILE